MKDAYRLNLPDNLSALYERMKLQVSPPGHPVRIHIPKENGKTRPLGISTLEDKIIQGAIREALEAVYEQDFKACSYGFRPKRSAHGAVRPEHRSVSRGGEVDPGGGHQVLLRAWIATRRKCPGTDRRRCPTPLSENACT